MGRGKAFYIICGIVLIIFGTLLSVHSFASANGTYRRFLPAIQKAETIQCTSNLDNPGFEYGLQCWEYDSTQGGIDIHTSMRYHPGNGYNSARLGSSVENNRLAWISQDVYVPVERPTLTYWHYVDSQEPNCHQYTFYDFVSVVINKDESSPVRSYELCDDIVNQTWVKRSIDLYAYRGRVVNLKVSFESDFINPSDFYVDDFRFE
jgi:hypothetical protein